MWDVPSVAHSHLVSTQSLVDKLKHGTVVEEPEKWAPRFHQWLSSAATHKMSALLPLRVTINRPIFEFPLTYDEESLVTNFGKLIRPRRDVRRLAAVVLYAMQEKYELDMDLDERIQDDLFYGAHMRSAKNAADIGWPNTDTQSHNYISDARSNQIQRLYLASDLPQDIIEFRKHAVADENFDKLLVDTKHSLLSKSEFSIDNMVLESLTWDQQAMVDYEVLLRSSRFGGLKESAFSWNIAMRRHVVHLEGLWQGLENDGALKTWGLHTFKDSYSILYGDEGGSADKAASIWP